MADEEAAAADLGSPLQWTRRTLRRTWNDMRSVYYANSFIWRVFKSGALLFLGLFCWTGANLLLSYRPDWAVLRYVMAYGFLLLLWGPLTHFVIVPLVIRVRRRGADNPASRFVARHGSKANLTVFVALVVVLAAFPVGPMTFEFQLPEGGDGGDVNPQLQCTKSGGVIHCHLSDSRGIDSVVVTTGGETVTVDDAPPYDFDVRIDDVAAVRGQKQFEVELRDEDGRTLRRYIRYVDTIPGE